jgi:putative ubiquitin-RnfH superfamily antitoxin RatB of RatAB toxin-antitoxin module
LAGSALGIFGKVAQRDQPLKDGDRIEIYRPLAEEPKLARRNRASKSGRS